MTTANGLPPDLHVNVPDDRPRKFTPLGPGREHWADAGCAVFHRGGLTMGQVIGETNPEPNAHSTARSPSKT